MPAVRRAGPEDAGRVALAAQASFLETFAGLLEGADILAHCEREHAAEVYRRWLANAAAALWLAETEHGASPVGYALMAPPDLPVPTSDGDLELKRIYLLSRYQGGGAGQALLAAVIEEARRREASRLLLGVYAGNDRAIAFYRRNGFVRIGERQFQVGETPYQDLVFARMLEPKA